MTGAEASTPAPVLSIRGLSVDYGWGPGAAHAVSEVDLVLRRGQVLGLAGESGSGKSTLAYAAARLLRPPGRVVTGEVRYQPHDGDTVDVLTMSDSALRSWRWNTLSIVAQASMNALNPVVNLATQLTDALEVHRPQMTARERRERAGRALEMVGIPRSRLRAFPHQLSGGMRQRAIIAMALILEPEVVILDEPTTALDVVVQRDILAQLTELSARLSLSVIFITHDLSLLLEIADEIAIMYAGKVIEQASAASLYRDPLHPYAAGLLASFPSLSGPRRSLTGISGSPPDPRSVPSGCSFHPRCPEAAAICSQKVPPLVDHGGRVVACLAREGLPPWSRNQSIAPNRPEVVPDDH